MDPARTFALQRRLRTLRRVSQGLFLTLFLVLLLETSVDMVGAAGAPPRLRGPVALFLEIDPLAAVGSVLATHALYRHMIWAALLIAATIVLGRFFCGWVCPFGTINHLVSALPSRRLRGAKRLEANRWQPWQRWKYGLLAGLLAAAAAGSLLTGLLDPISVLTRALALLLLPGWNNATQALYAGLADAAGPLSPVGRGLAEVVALVLVRPRIVVFEGALLAGGVFLLALGANRLRTRFWCRGVCPLGALLGLLSRSSILGLHKEPALCTGCNKCALHCQGADDPQPGMAWRQHECHLCMNCVASCPEAGIAFRFFPSTAETTARVDLGRRTVTASLLAGAAAVPILRAGAHPSKTPHPALVRPPGSLPEADFLARCVRCGECMNVCPNNALHPTLLQAGTEGVWSPMLQPRIGYCEPTCVLCGDVCPTGAIAAITSAVKGWVPPEAGGARTSDPVRIGTAFYDHGRCLPWAMAKECIVCEEWCPTTPKAIYFEEVEVQDREGNYLYLRRPHVDPAICVGCGACAYACPVKGAPAVYVHSVGESRSETNRILLEGAMKPRPRGTRPAADSSAGAEEGTP